MGIAQAYVSTGALEALLSSMPALTVIVAPPGFGKTALVQEAIDRLRTQERGLRPSLYRAGSNSADYSFEEADEIVFLDDAHAIEESTLIDLMTRALSRRRGKLVVATRSLPSLDLVSLQLEGKVLILEAGDLVLDEERVTRLFERCAGKSLEGDLPRELHELTEGWPLAVMLCGSMAQRSPQRHIVSLAGLLPRERLRVYFETRVHEGITPEVHQLLHRLAILDHISPELVLAALGSPARVLFNKLQNSRFLLSRSRRRDGWYELHRLYRQFLLEEAPETVQREAPRIVAAAAEWSLQHGFVDDAIEYRIRAGMFREAQQLLDRQAWATVRRTGDFPRITNWIERLERAGANITSSLRLWAIWSLVLRARLAEASVALDELEAGRELTEADKAFAARLRLSIAARSQASESVCVLAEAWLEKWQEIAPQHVPGIGFMLGLARFDLCEEVAAKRKLQLAREIACRVNCSYAKAWTLCAEAYMELLCGHANEALLLVNAALATARTQGEAPSPLFGAIALVAAAVHYEKGDVASTQEYLTFARPHRDTHMVIEAWIAGQEAAVGVAESIGGSDAAIVELRRWSSGATRVAEAGRVQLVHVLIRAGRVQEARREFDASCAPLLSGEGGMRVSGSRQHDLLHALAWLHYAEGDSEQAQALLRKLLPHAEAHGRGRRLVSLYLLRAAVSAARGDVMGGKRALSRALTRAAAGGLMRTVLNAAWALSAELSQYSLDNQLDHALATFVQDLRVQLGLTSAQMRPLQPVQPLAPLTAREREILEMLDSDYTVQDLANSMSISVATAKWHIRNIYNKLGVHSRAGALAIVRRAEPARTVGAATAQRKPLN